MTNGWHSTFFAALNKSGNITIAANAAGRSYRHIWHMRKTVPEFDARCKEILANRAGRLADGSWPDHKVGRPRKDVAVALEVFFEAYGFYGIMRTAAGIAGIGERAIYRLIQRHALQSRLLAARARAKYLEEKAPINKRRDLFWTGLRTKNLDGFMEACKSVDISPRLGVALLQYNDRLRKASTHGVYFPGANYDPNAIGADYATEILTPRGPEK